MQAPDDASDLPDEIVRQLAEYRQALDLPELDVGLDVAVWFHTGQSHRASGQIESAGRELAEAEAEFGRLRHYFERLPHQT